jgi:hypothetical protein
MAKNNFHNVKILIELYQFPHILSFTETWLTDEHDDVMIPYHDKYDILRRDRTGHGGGVCLMIRNDLEYVECPLVNEEAEVESVFADISLARSRGFRIGVMYRPPHNNQGYFEALKSEVETSLAGAPAGRLVLTGDFNCPGIDWTNSTTRGLIDQELFTFSLEHALHQHVFEPTRGGNVLDLVFSSDVSLVDNVEVCPPLSSDHNVIRFDVTAESPNKKEDTNKRNFAKADYGDIKEFLRGVDWIALQNMFPSVQDFWNVTKETLNFCIENFVPLKKSSTQPFSTKRTRTLQRRLRRVAKKVARRPTAIAIESYESLIIQLKKSMFSDQRTEEDKVLRNGTNSAFYSLVRRRTKAHKRTPALKKDDGTVITSDADKATLLNSYFSSVFTKDDDAPLIEHARTTSKLSTINFTEFKVHDAMKEMKNNFSRGPDGVPSVFIRQLSDDLAAPLSFLFNLCMEKGELPKEWLDAHIVPIHKKGSRAKAGNYRPISLTSVICKIMERVIKNELMGYLSANSLLSEKQHGFRSGKSTFTQLVSTMNDWMNAADLQHGFVVSVFFDFAKAFDSVVHSKLFTRLAAHGIDGKLLQFFKAFLTNRRQRVVVGDQMSDYEEVTSGVPQGTVLGPVCFVLFINSLPEHIRDCILELFADDVKLYLCGQNYDNQAVIQADINRVQAWAKACQLTLAVDKCFVLRIGQSGAQPFMVNDSPLSDQSEVKDLGIKVTPDLSFSSHVNEVASKAFRKTGLLYKVIKGRDTALMCRMYETFVRPIVEHNTSIWNPHHLGLIEQLEKVQRRYTKRIPALKFLNYPSRLRQLNMEPLEARRMKTDLINCFKILKNKVPVSREKFFEFNPGVTRGHSWKLKIQHPRTESKKFSFACRVVPLWNELDERTVSCRSAHGFKLRLKSYNLNHRIRGSYLREQ